MIRFHMTIGKGTDPETWTRITFRLPDFLPWRGDVGVELTGVYPHECAARQAAWRYINARRAEHDSQEVAA